ncbi:MAG: hypothetical protein VZR11_10655 [Succinimonas sp.]|nr:hypothetical protein [Succinimonas sp.]
MTLCDNHGADGIFRCRRKAVYNESELNKELEAARDIKTDPDDCNVRIIKTAPWERYRKR